MTGAADPSEYPTVKAPQPWTSLFDEVLVRQAHADYGFLPDHWKEARHDLLDVDEGRVRLVLCEDHAFLLRGNALLEASVVMLLLNRLVDAGIQLQLDSEASA